MAFANVAQFRPAEGCADLIFLMPTKFSHIQNGKGERETEFPVLKRHGAANCWLEHLSFPFGESRFSNSPPPFTFVPLLKIRHG